MKPWLARTLLWSAIALALLASTWLLLDSKWSGEVARLRARPSASVEQLLPPVDPAQDAAPIYLEACRLWRAWRSPANDAAVNRSMGLWNSKRIDRPDEWTAEEEAGLSDLDVPEMAHVRALLHTASQREHCRLWDSSTGSLRSFDMAAFLTLSQVALLPVALRAAKHADAGAWIPFETELKLGVHLRQDPLIVSLMLSRVISRQALEALPVLLARLPLDPECARRLLAALRGLQPDKDALRALDGERVLFAEPAWDSLVEGKFPRGVWMRTDLADSLSLKVLRPWRLLDEAKYFELLADTRARLSANPWEELPEQEVSDIFPITQTLNSGFPKLSGSWLLKERHSRDLAEIALRLAIARAESGSYPLALDALGELPLEPLTSEPYAYVRAGEGYTLDVSPEARSSWSIPR